ncbi:hypothetical protein BVC80_1835g658 [Macleaya cordata]|uniref:DUF7953 domain-containing protein n=1 Tax=Macleaya cordata TaxID=56857 RepID=A0A200R6C3_MACCD|nr:hypothetical protein BVC80_1835g658 [Macleaya cordata]
MSNSRAVAVILIFYSILLLLFPPGISSSGVVTLESIQIFTTHEWLNGKPTLYFLCQKENKTFLPDVKEKNSLYTFKGEESWQPLTEFVNKKCKRCGFYEKDTLKTDDIFDEWEFCPSDFMAPDGKYVRFKDKEFNATFLCPQCIPLGTSSDRTSGSHIGVAKEKGINVVLVISITVVVSVGCIVGAIAACRYWQRKKREQDRARFLKLFDDVDDIEDELGLG